jgi:hypothetical protein
MSRAFTARAILLALSTLVPVSAAHGDAQSHTRVTILGTGKVVAIERSEAPARKRRSEAAVPAGPLGEAVRLKDQGASDIAVISYLRAHEAELPPVVGSEDVKQLRKTGAGKSVIAYLATLAAIDIGETGQGYETAVSAAPVSPIDLETSAYGTSDGYPLFGGYGAPYPTRLARRGFPRLRRMVLPPGLPAFPLVHPFAPPFSRHLTNRVGKKPASG